MLRPALFISISIIFCKSLLAQPDTLWTWTLSGPDNSYAFCTEQAPNGDIIICAALDSAQGGFTYIFYRFDQFGNLLTENRNLSWPNPWGIDMADVIIKNPLGGYVMQFGRGEQRTDFQWIDENGYPTQSIVIYPSGNIAGPSNGAHHASMCNISDSLFAFAGIRWFIYDGDPSPWSQSTIYFINYETANYSFFPVFGNSPRSLTDFGDSEVCLAHGSSVYLGGYDIDGNQLWGGNTNLPSAYIFSIRVKHLSGNFYYVGRSPGNTIYAVSKVGTGGTVLWTRPFSGFEISDDWYFPRTADISVVYNHNCFVSGTAIDDSTGNGTDFLAAGIGSAGDSLWSHRYGTARNETLYDSKPLSSGGLIMCGSSAEGNDNDIYIVCLQDILTSNEQSPIFPGSFLFSAFPNPFNSTTTLSLSLPQTQKLSINLFDITGRLVKTIADDQLTSGEHKIQIDMNGLASGIYFVNANSPLYHSTQKLVFLK